jgi:hypothetical protein
MRVRLLLVVIALAVVGCGPPTGQSLLDHPTPPTKTNPSVASSAEPPVSPGATDPEPAPSATVESSATPFASGPLEPFPCSTLRPAPTRAPGAFVAADLEALLPKMVGGCPALVFSVPGSVFNAGGDMCVFPPCGDEVPALAAKLGVAVDKVAVGFAIPSNNIPVVWVIAIHLPGSKAGQLIPARLATTDPIARTDLTIAGRNATWEAYNAFVNADYLIAYKDVLFILLYANDPGDMRFEAPAPPADVVAAVEALP